MDKTKSFFLWLLSVYLGNVPKYDIDIESVDWDDLLNLSMLNSVQGIIYKTLTNLKIETPIDNKLKECCLATASVAITQEYWGNRVIKIFNEYGIKHTLIKGFVIKDYYTAKEDRTFGDIDILITEEDREKSHNALTSIGFKREEYLSGKNVWTYIKGSVSLEIHTSIIYQDLGRKFDYVNYFKEKAKNAECIYGYTYELKKEDHLLYVLTHIAKHFGSVGVGIRMIMDIAVFYNKFVNEINFEYIKHELRAINLYNFAQSMFYVCNKYFNTTIPCEISELNCEDEVMCYILNHGVFGTENKDVAAIIYRKNGQDKLMKRILANVFPDYEQLKKSKVWFAECPKYMLPYGWIRRLVEKLIIKECRQNLSSRVKGVLLDSEDVDIHKRITKAVGL